MPQFIPTREFEFLQYVGDVILHCVGAHALQAGYFRVRQSVPNCFGHTPFRGCQKIVVTGAPAGLSC